MMSPVASRLACALFPAAYRHIQVQVRLRSLPIHCFSWIWILALWFVFVNGVLLKRPQFFENRDFGLFLACGSRAINLLPSSARSVILLLPMQYIATTKVAGGKLLRVKTDVDGGVLRSVSITGDFFMHPEDGVTKLEAALTGLSAKSEIGVYVSRLNDVIHSHGFELLGFSASDIAQTLHNAIHPVT